VTGAISTGSIALDEALGPFGGMPRGRVVELYGPESSGKTTVALNVIAQAQHTRTEQFPNGLICGFIDAEHAFDPDWARTCGVRVDPEPQNSYPGLLVSQPDNGEQALSVAERMARSGLVAVIVIDSVAALVPKAEIEGDMGDSHVGLQARLMSQALRKLTPAVSGTNTLCIFINQLREKIGVFFGNPETTAGGKALKFYASVRADVRGVQTLKDGETAVGRRVKVTVSKNKCAAPFRKAEFDLMFGEGLSREGELIDLGVDRGVLGKSGAWYSYNGELLGQGKENTRQKLRASPELSREVEAKVRAAGPYKV
jgi:recombination protein RecA